MISGRRARPAPPESIAKPAPRAYDSGHGMPPPGFSPMMPASPRRDRLALAIASAGALAACAWFAGFLWFVRDATRLLPPPPVADGIVALTGGADRVAAAIALLEEDRGRLLLISGVGPSTAPAALLRGTGTDYGALRDRLTLGRQATTTLGNADEAANWARANELHSLIVVTAGYHMRRALTEMRRALPDVRLYPAPVLPPALRGRGSLTTLRLLADEYTKWLAAEAGLTQLERMRQPSA